MSTPCAFKRRASSTDCSMSQLSGVDAGAQSVQKSATSGQRSGIAPHGNHGVAQEAGPVLEAAAIFVRPGVAERRGIRGTDSRAPHGSRSRQSRH